LVGCGFTATLAALVARVVVQSLHLKRARSAEEGEGANEESEKRTQRHNERTAYREPIPAQGLVFGFYV